MYAVGGQDGVSCLYIVEKYDPQENRWYRVASMSSRRLGVGVAVLDGYLYAIGGSDGTSPLNTVEKYDPKTNRWSPVAPMGTRRKHLGAALFQDKLYVGVYDLLCLLTMEVFACNVDKSMNTSVHQLDWSLFSSNLSTSHFEKIKQFSQCMTPQW